MTPGAARRTGRACALMASALFAANCQSCAAPIQCQGDADCPRGYSCDLVGGQCVRSEQPADAATDAAVSDGSGVDASMADHGHRDTAGNDQTAVDGHSVQDAQPADTARADHSAADALPGDQGDAGPADQAGIDTALARDATTDISVASDQSLVDSTWPDARTADAAIHDAISHDRGKPDAAPGIDSGGPGNDCSSIVCDLDRSPDCCAGLCTDLSNDPFNCGVCGTVCGGEEFCIPRTSPDLQIRYGQCSCLIDACPVNGGGGGTTCSGVVSNRRCVCAANGNKPCPVGSYCCSDGCCTQSCDTMNNDCWTADCIVAPCGPNATTCSNSSNQKWCCAYWLGCGSTYCECGPLQ